MFNERLNRPNWKRAEHEAIALLQKNGVYEPPIDPVEIARSINVDVRFVTFTGASAEVSGLFDFEQNAILVNNSQSGRHQTFTVAHELGHKVLHEDWAKTEDYKVLWRDLRENRKDRWEQEANLFAANLLMPRQFVDDYKNLGVFDISRIFAVSETFARHRLTNLYGY